MKTKTQLNQLIKAVNFFLFTGFLIFALNATSCYAQNLNANPVKLSRLDKHSTHMAAGMSWGVPFNKGEIKPENSFRLEDEKGVSMPVQNWPLAYWPDGSLKWVGFSTVVPPEGGSTFFLNPVEKENESYHGQKISVTENSENIIINTGALECILPRQGNKLFESIVTENREVSGGAELICLVQSGPDKEWGPQPTVEKFTGRIEEILVEQSGPVRAVVKISGRHFSSDGLQKLIPFSLRLYFYSGLPTIRMVYSVIYDGDQHHDFIKGLGLFVDVPLDEEVYNRHVRFSGENDGFWMEPAQPLTGRRMLSGENNYYEMQIEGKRIPERESFSDRQKFLVDNWASWNDFRLSQLTTRGFRIQKRTNDQSAWIDAGAGGRSTGLVFAGDVSGGIAVGVKDFWQSFPSTMEVRDLRSEKAKIRTWFWSPESVAMDLRHYDTLAWGHSLEASYEDVQPGFSTPEGIARTTELLIYAASSVPSAQSLQAISNQANTPQLLTVSPEYLHSVPVFGVWSLPDTSSKGKKWIEDQLHKAFIHYKLEVEQRNWYGFWDYGDVMHAYDPVRHSWRYDIGGYAWANTELMPNLWLWYSYLRTGNPEIFTMAEAMTRHTGEVDVYHLGPFKGLGSRHNVRHWGCGSKEVRVSQAAISRFYYYLTSDERTGDLMHEVTEAANEAIGKTDPLRLILPEGQYPTHARVGPDWMALAGNWMTEWERTGNDEFRNKIKTGVDCLAEMPFGLFSGEGSAMGYDPETHKMYQLDKDHIGVSHLSVLMGGPEVAFEMGPLLNNKKWDKLWLQYCKLYGAPAAETEKELGKKVGLGQAEHWYARLPAYYFSQTGEVKWAKRAWQYFLGDSGRERVENLFDSKLVNTSDILYPVYEIKGISTNNTAQWCLNAIQILELAGEHIPDDHPAFHKKNQ